jgi:amidase
MKRRNFLRHSAISAAAVPGLLLPLFSRPTVGYADDKDFPMFEASIDSLQQKMQSGEWTAESIAKQYLKRIREIDSNGPKLNAVIELNPDALDIARALDRERKAGKLRGPLHGIPVLVKDNIDTGDKMMTTAGALALEGNRAAQDAFIIRQLRAAGAVLLGKTNLSEWANFRSTRSSSGWSSRGGQTKNPYLLDRSPCGSSAGSGTAVAANLCALAIGTETNGSISCPSSINGIVGIKPTVGLLSRSGIIPISKTQDTAGPMARTVRDAAILLGALTGLDAADAVTLESKGKSHTDYSRFLDNNGLKGKRIGVEKSFLKGHEGVTALLQEAIETMEKLGAIVVEVELEAQLKDIGDAEYSVLCYEFKDGLNQYLANAKARVKSLAEVIDFNRKHEATAMPWFKQEILETCQEKGGLDSKEYLDALEKVVGTSRKAIDSLLRDQQLDAIIGPANGPSWCIDLVNGDAFTGYGAYSPAAMAGYPSITVPMGMVHELPIGLAFTGMAYGEPALIALAYAYEQASKKRKAPKFLPGN